MEGGFEVEGQGSARGVVAAGLEGALGLPGSECESRRVDRRCAAAARGQVPRPTGTALAGRAARCAATDRQCRVRSLPARLEGERAGSERKCCLTRATENARVRCEGPAAWRGPSARDVTCDVRRARSTRVGCRRGCRRGCSSGAARVQRGSAGTEHAGGMYAKSSLDADESAGSSSRSIWRMGTEKRR